MSTETHKIRIRRAAHNAENTYFLHRRATAQDRNLSYEARGVLAYLLSKPTDWVVRPKELQQEGSGRDKIYRILKELADNRYLFREFLRNELGVVTGIDYIVHEEPFPENPDTANPDTAQPDTANTDITKDRVLQNKDSDKPKTPRKRDPFFDVLARDFFAVDLEDKPGVALVAPRVSRIKKALLAADSTITAEELFQVWHWLTETRAGLTMPQHEETIGKAIVEYRNRDKRTERGRFDDYVDHPDQELYPGVRIPRAHAEEILRSKGK